MLGSPPCRPGEALLALFAEEAPTGGTLLFEAHELGGRGGDDEGGTLTCEARCPIPGRGEPVVAGYRIGEIEEDIEGGGGLLVKPQDIDSLPGGSAAGKGGEILRGGQH
jgi:hypothetical protein